MTYDDELMRTLAAIAGATGIHTYDDYELVAVGREFTETVLPDHHLSELLVKGWIETLDVGADLHMNVTPQGHYAVGRWQNQQRKRVRA